MRSNCKYRKVKSHWNIDRYNFSSTYQIPNFPIPERKREIGELQPSRVTQGKTFNNHEVEFAAKHAVDKDLSTQAASETDNGAGWLKLEFDQTHFIHKVVMYYRFYKNWYNPVEQCGQSVAYFMDCVDEHNNVDVSVYQGEVKQKSCGKLQLTYALEQSDQIYTLLCNTEGDTVKLSKSTGHLALFEIVVTNTGIYQDSYTFIV